jgi:hypothetical protein
MGDDQARLWDLLTLVGNAVFFLAVGVIAGSAVETSEHGTESLAEGA